MRQGQGPIDPLENVGPSLKDHEEGHQQHTVEENGELHVLDTGVTLPGHASTDWKYATAATVNTARII